ncbi:pyridoxal-dependent decarboxylase [Pantoea sp.]|uniref:pyridoxal-dependent decarboxylase n=1 Tax=Pantoea sp. TaxID=69393 RepID=UPI0028A88773|nr:pyridoxal-dependent decarboxylase [Pantoea sp.]
MENSLGVSKTFVVAKAKFGKTIPHSFIRHVKRPHTFTITNFCVHDKVRKRLDKIYTNLVSQQELSLGYPVSQKFDYSAISPFINIHLNNAGDPFENTSVLLHTREMEQEVLEYFRQLWHAELREPLTQESFWGYVLAMGSTEGNMYALWSAREYFRVSQASGKTKRKELSVPVLYYSQESHYSLEKCASILGITTFQEMGDKYFPGQCPITADGKWPHGVPVDQHGAVNPESLTALVDFFAAHGHPPMIVLNVGTTFQGGFDDAQVIWQQLSPVLERHDFCLETEGDSRPDFWIHIDGALGAAYLPYLEMAYQSKISKVKGPQFDFRLPFVSSIVMSSHKWYGAPFASGIYMTKEKYRMQPATLPEYIHSPDTTLCGSRNGMSALFLWYMVNTVSQPMQSRIAAQCEQLAAYAYEQLTTIKVIHPSFRVERGPQSLVVVFTRPGKEIFQKFHLSSRGDLAHIVVMPHVTRSAIDSLVEALQRNDAFFEQDLSSDDTSDKYSGV